MRAKRLKITKENYDGLRKVADALPKFSKGNDSVREAMNISSGTWHYLRISENYEDFAKLRAQANKPIVDKPAPREEVTLTSFQQVPRLLEQAHTTPNELVQELHNINNTLIRLCVAWESTPTKKGWLK